MLIVSIILFFSTLLLIFVVIAWLPSDYFVRGDLDFFKGGKNSGVLRRVGQVVYNILGVILIIAGVIMLVLPGQGVLTIVIGLILLDFPGKKRLLNRLVALKSVQNALNYLRKKMGKPLFIFPKTQK